MIPIPAIPVIETERLLLRPLKESDVNEIFQLRSDETINKYIDRAPAESTDDALAFIHKIQAFSNNRQTLYWAITIKGSEQLAGTIVFWNFNHEERKAELGYELLPRHQGKKYMQEALKKVINLGFHQLHLSAIEAWTHPENRSSIGVIEKLGFTRDLEAEKIKPPESKEIIYSLSATAHS